MRSVSFFSVVAPEIGAVISAQGSSGAFIIIIAAVLLLFAGMGILRQRVRRAFRKDVGKTDLSFLGMVGRHHALHVVTFHEKELLLGVWEGGMKVLVSEGESESLPSRASLRLVKQEGG